MSSLARSSGTRWWIAVAVLSLAATFTAMQAEASTLQPECVQSCAAKQSSCKAKGGGAQCTDDYKMCVDRCSVRRRAPSAETDPYKSEFYRYRDDGTPKMSRCELRCDDSGHLCDRSNPQGTDGCAAARKSCQERCGKQ